MNYVMISKDEELEWGMWYTVDGGKGKIAIFLGDPEG